MSVTGAIAFAALLFMYLPVAVLVVYSFNDSRFGIEWAGFTMKWYEVLLTNPQTIDAFWNTVVVAVFSTAISTVLGSLLAIAFRFYRFPYQRLLEGAFYLPVVLPDIVMGMGLLGLFALLQIPLGLLTIVLAQASFQTPFVWMVVQGTLQDFPVEIVEAARDLGADPPTALRKVVLPIAWPGILAGAMVAFTLSIDDFVISYFTAGPGCSTLSIRIYSMVRRGVTPDVNAMCAILLVATTILTFLSRWVLSLGPRAGGKAPSDGLALAGH